MKIDKNSKLGLFLGHFMPGVMRPLRVLWNEIIGFVFLAFGVVLGSGAIRAYRALPPGEANLGRIVLLFGLPAVMLFFGISSFLRARRISRS